MANPETGARTNRAIVVALGIMASRVLGLVRWSLTARYFGSGPHADVLKAAFQAPNALQNLLGEGTMSAAFIPVYSKMLEEGRPEAAGRFAGSILGLLTAVVCTGVLLGIWLAHPICSVLMPGFVGDAAEVAKGQREVDRLLLSVDMVRLAFPMAGILVVSSWALGVLNSHRRFFMPYFAPVLWNVTIIGTLLGVGNLVGLTPWDLGGESDASILPEELTRLLTAVFAGGLVGGLLQFLVQLPSVVLVLKGFRFSLSTRVDGVRRALNAVVPALAGRGIAQLSAYLDILLATHLVGGAVASIGYAQVLYILPISLFGLSVAAAELPELSRIGSNSLPRMAKRINAGLRQGLFLAIPTALGYIALGYVIVGAIYRGGSFGVDDNWLVYVILATYSLGLLATVSSRLLQNGFWALGDTRTPARMAMVRAAIALVIAIPVMFALDRLSVSLITGPGTSVLYFGAVGLAFGSAVASWVEWWLLGRVLKRRLGNTFMPWRAVGTMTIFVIAALVPSGILWYFAQSWPPVWLGITVVAVFAATYLLLARQFRRPELTAWIGRLR